jgi:ribosome-binding protein aMBF1 (putative translation factor)
MNWDSEKIRDLRLRLGFSPSDLARRLQCECSDVRSWEVGIAEPMDFQLQQLDLLQKQAEECAQEMAHHPLAESLLDTDELGQIDLHQVKTRFSRNN